MAAGYEGQIDHNIGQLAPSDGVFPMHDGDTVSAFYLEETPYPAGSAVVRLNQRLSKVAIQWLEPQGPDSALAWGFFDSIFEQKEYGEAYVLEKLAREMMAKDPKLKAEFERKVQTDPRFAANPAARLEFFYDRSHWSDAHLGLYPVGRLTKLDTLPIK